MTTRPALRLACKRGVLCGSERHETPSFPRERQERGFVDAGGGVWVHGDVSTAGRMRLPRTADAGDMRSSATPDGGRLVQILDGQPDEERALDRLLMAFSADG